MNQETCSNFDRYWRGGLDAAVEEKFGGANVVAALHQSITTAAIIVAKLNFLQCTSTFFFISNGDL